MLSLRPLRRTLARTRFSESERRRRYLSVGYAALASVVAITASAVVASRRPGATNSPEPDARTAVALVSPPYLPAGPSSSLAGEARDDDGPVSVVPEPSPALLAPIESAKRHATLPRAQAATKSQPHHVVVAIAPPASPVASAPPAPSPVLVRNDPWLNPVSRPESAASAPFDVGRASVSFANVVTSAGISGAKVKVSLSHAPLAACYQRALRLRPLEAPLEAELRLAIDFGGRVVNASLSKDGNLSGLRGCIESAVRGVQIRDVDTGDGTATVQLRFSSR
jgi:hypothetical protein